MQDSDDIDDVCVEGVHNGERSTRYNQFASSFDSARGRRLRKFFQLIDSVEDAFHLRCGCLRINRIQVLERVG